MNRDNRYIWVLAIIQIVAFVVSGYLCAPCRRAVSGHKANASVSDKVADPSKSDLSRSGEITCDGEVFAYPGDKHSERTEFFGWVLATLLAVPGFLTLIVAYSSSKEGLRSRAFGTPGADFESSFLLMSKALWMVVGTIASMLLLFAALVNQVWPLDCSGSLDLCAIMFSIAVLVAVVIVVLAALLTPFAPGPQLVESERGQNFHRLP